MSLFGGSGSTPAATSSFAFGGGFGAAAGASAPGFSFGTASAGGSSNAAPLSFGLSSSSAAGGSAFSFGGGAAPSASPSLFGKPGGGLFGTPGATPGGGGGLLGAAPTMTPSGSAPPAGGASLFGATPTATPGTSLFGTPALGATGSSLFGSSTPGLAQSAASPLFGQAPTPAASLFGAQSAPSLFSSSTPLGGGSLFSSLQPTAPGVGAGSSLFPSLQPTTQMALAAPLMTNLADRKIQAIVDAYNEDPNNPHYRFRHFFLSVTPPQNRVKPPGAPEVLWEEAMTRLEGLEGAERDRLWPELVHGFQGLAERVRLQDQALAEDVQRLQILDGAVRQLSQHYEASTALWALRLRRREQELSRRLLRAARLVEMLEGRAGGAARVPPLPEEQQLSARLRAVSSKLQGPQGKLVPRAAALVSASRGRAAVLRGGVGDPTTGATVDGRSLEEAQLILKQQTDAVERLSALVKRDARDLELMANEGKQGQANSRITNGSH